MRKLHSVPETRTPCNLGVQILYLDPGFYNPAAEQYWLASNSLLRQWPNHGQNHADNPVVPEQDIGEHPRPGPDGFTDMGAYESDGGNWP